MAYDWVISATIYTAGSILSALTAKTPEVYKSANDKIKETMIKKFNYLKERHEMASNLAASISGKSVDYYLHSFNADEAMRTIRESGNTEFQLYESGKIKKEKEQKEKRQEFEDEQEEMQQEEFEERHEEAQNSGGQNYNINIGDNQNNQNPYDNEEETPNPYD